VIDSLNNFSSFNLFIVSNLATEHQTVLVRITEKKNVSRGTVPFYQVEGSTQRNLQVPVHVSLPNLAVLYLKRYGRM